MAGMALGKGMSFYSPPPKMVSTYLPTLGHFFWVFFSPRSGKKKCAGKKNEKKKGKKLRRKKANKNSKRKKEKKNEKKKREVPQLSDHCHTSIFLRASRKTVFT